MLKLYSYHNSICTQKVLITLAEKGQAFTTQNVDLFRNEQFAPWYLAINPKGVVPALDHDGHVITESSLICEYLDDVFPTPRLVPADPYLRAKMRLWSKRVDEHLFEATRELSFSAMFREKMRGMSEEQREGRYRNTGDPIKRARLISTYELGAESPFVYQGIGAWELALHAMEQDLATRGGLWLLGEAMTLADINMMPFLARLHYLNLLDIWITDRPLVQAWFARAQALPSFATAITAWLTETDLSAMHLHGSAIRTPVAAQLAAYRERGS